MTMPFWCQTNTSKTNWLIAQAEKDTFIQSITTALKFIGFTISYPLFSRPGHYQPQELHLNTNPQDLQKEVKNLHINGFIKAKISISPILNRDISLITLLHELIHFHQDLHGLFPTPIFTNGQPSFTLDEASLTQILLTAESMATTESIRAAHRLKNNGHPHAWNGATTSKIWKHLATQYEQDISITDKKTAARNLHQNWFKSPLHQLTRQQAKSLSSDKKSSTALEIATIKNFYTPDEFPHKHSSISSQNHSPFHILNKL